MKSFKKYYLLPASPDEVFLALTNPLTIKLWTGEEAQMSTTVGEEFSLWDGSINGKNLGFEQGKMIEQEWYFGAEIPSIVTIKLHSHKKGTSVELNHTNIPEDVFDDIVDGWTNVYFADLLEFYEEVE